MRLRRLFVVLAVLCTGAFTSAEELLEKKSGEYLGWKKSASKFVTCSGGSLTIGDGKVTKTQEKCRKRSFRIVGKIVAVNEREIVIHDPDGELITYQVPTATRPEVHGLASGSEVVLEITAGDSADDPSLHAMTIISGEAATDEYRLAVNDNDDDDDTATASRRRMRKD